MALGNMPDSNRLDREHRLERQQRRFKITANICSPKDVLLNELNTRRLWSSAVPLERLNRVDKLVDGEESNVESLNSVRSRTCKK